MQVFIPPTGRTLTLEQQTKSTIDDAFFANESQYGAICTKMIHKYVNNLWRHQTKFAYQGGQELWIIQINSTPLIANINRGILTQNKIIICIDTARTVVHSIQPRAVLLNVFWTIWNIAN